MPREIPLPRVWNHRTPYGVKIAYNTLDSQTTRFTDLVLSDPIRRFFRLSADQRGAQAVQLVRPAQGQERTTCKRHAARLVGRGVPSLLFP